MVNRRVSRTSSKELDHNHRPATTPEARENQLIALAVDLTEKQLREGTASSQVITHYLKLGSSREKLEQERLISENKLAEAKISAMESHQKIEELYAEAIKAMRSYSGQEPIALEPDPGEIFD